MEIRSATLFADPALDVSVMREFYQAAAQAFTPPLQTTRLALPPFPAWWPALPEEGDPARLAEVARAQEQRWLGSGAEYISIGPVQLQHARQWIGRIPHILNATGTLFASVEIADREGRIDLTRCRDAARVIKRCSDSENGFGNLYFAALANCPAGSPFFPVAYHKGGEPSFALAMQAADLAEEAVDKAPTIEAISERLTEAVESAADRLAKEALALAEETGITFAGIDFSLAPHPSAGNSLAAAIERTTGQTIDAPGNIFAAALLAEAVDRAHFPRCGFSGLFLPVLEDGRLARRTADGGLSLANLLAMASVCGTGLDVVPLPGDVALDELAAILLDVAALASRLDKPLTARLLPLPGMAAGDPVRFDFSFFADGHVMGLVGARHDEGPGRELDGRVQLQAFGGGATGRGPSHGA